MEEVKRLVEGMAMTLLAGAPLCGPGRGVLAVAAGCPYDGGSPWVAQIASGADPERGEREVRNVVMRTVCELGWPQLSEAVDSVTRMMVNGQQTVPMSAQQSILAALGGAPWNEPMEKAVSQELASGSNSAEMVNSAMNAAPQPNFSEKFFADSLECPCCFSMLVQPVCLPTGHSMCSPCARRALERTDPSTGTAAPPACPMTRRPLDAFVGWCNQREQLSGQQPVCSALDSWIRTTFPTEYAARLEQIQVEQRELDEKLPIFVCSIAFPGTPCPLHIFEPRYRLMMRRAMEGTRQFVMAVALDEGNGDSGEKPTVGTVMGIKTQRLLPDGRSFVECTGLRRVKVVPGTVEMRDGYPVAALEAVVDEEDPATTNDEAITAQLMEQSKYCHAEAKRLIKRHPQLQDILGEIPEVYGDDGELVQDPAKVFMNAQRLSFWFSSFAAGHNEQLGESLLQCTSTTKRLAIIITLLEI